jgi:hypothetical protein
MLWDFIPIDGSQCCGFSVHFWCSAVVGWYSVPWSDVMVEMAFDVEEVAG